MGWFTRWLVRARATFSGRRDRDLRAEHELHLDLLEEEYAALGISPDAARRLAHRDFGNATLYREVSHDLFSFRLIEDSDRGRPAQFYDVQSSDPWTIGAVMLLLTVTTLLSALRPARTASRVDPVALLQNE